MRSEGLTMTYSEKSALTQESGKHGYPGQTWPALKSLEKPREAEIGGKLAKQY